MQLSITKTTYQAAVDVGSGQVHQFTTPDNASFIFPGLVNLHRMIVIPSTAGYNDPAGHFRVLRNWVAVFRLRNNGVYVTTPYGVYNTSYIHFTNDNMELIFGTSVGDSLRINEIVFPTVMYGYFDPVVTPAVALSLNNLVLQLHIWTL